MNRHTWHATRSAGATCLMLTRASTTVDLVQHLAMGGRPVESTIRSISPVRLIASEEGGQPL